MNIFSWFLLGSSIIVIIVLVPIYYFGDGDNLQDYCNTLIILYKSVRILILISMKVFTYAME
jgi:hypothetical protein